MSNPFNPYQEWLGLSPEETSPNYYRLFGLDDFEPDSKKIAMAADVVQKTLREISPGQHLSAQLALLKQMEAAQQCLTDPDAKAAYDSTLKIAPRQDAPVPHVIPVGQPAMADGSRVVSTSLPEIMPRPSRHTHRRSRRSVGWTLMAIAIVGAFCVMAILYVTEMPRGESVTSVSPDEVASSEPTGRQNGAVKPAPELPVEPREPLPQGSGTTGREQHALNSSDAVVKAGDMTTEAEDTLPVAVESPDSAESEPTEAEIRAFRASIDDVIESLGARQLEEADTKIAASKQLAVTADQKFQYRGIQMLHMAVSNFWAAVHDSLRSLSAGREFEHKDLKVVVVESSPEKLVLRARGKNFTFDPDDLNPGLARTLAMLWFDPDEPTTPINVAAFLFVEPNGDRDEAITLWRDAANRGEDVEPLLKLAEIGQTE